MEIIGNRRKKRFVLFRHSKNIPCVAAPGVMVVRLSVPRVVDPPRVPVSTASPTPTYPPRTPSGAPKTAIATLLDISNQMTPDFAKYKCKKFLTLLQKLAEEQPHTTVKENIKILIQGKAVERLGII